MSKGRSGFSFKRFHIDHDRCGMKVGTDSILLATWVPLTPITRLLDLGTGSGIIALILAQRLEDSQTEIDAIEIEPQAAAQAQQNIANSPWPESVRVVNCAIQEWQSDPYDLIISNPPYFAVAQELPLDRALARQTHTLDHSELLASAWRLLSNSGKLALVLPTIEGEALCQEAQQLGFFLQQKVVVTGRAGKEPNRLLLLFTKQPTVTEVTQLTIQNELGYTAEFRALTHDFYLKM